MTQPVSALRAGAAVVDVTPEMGIQLAGDIGRPRPVEKIRDPLFAKALALEAGGKRLCYVAVDCAVRLHISPSASILRSEIGKSHGGTNERHQPDE